MPIIITKFFLPLDIVILISTSILGFRNKDYTKKIFYIHTIVLCIAFVLLLYIHIISDFRFEAVLLNTSTILPLIYKIGAVWSSNDGSIMLWLSIISIITSIYCCLVQKDVTKVCGIQAILINIFIIGIYFFNNPFQEALGSFTQGFGLNPLLQDEGLVIHPPILYTGQAIYCLIFAILIQVFFNRKDFKKKYIRDVLKLSSFGFLLLTAGICLGSWWAYRELGWGGFWFFDPIENLSLLPWFAAIGLHHCLVMIKRNNIFINYVFIFAYLACFSILISTFLSRSGLLISVHSFAQDKGYFVPYLGFGIMLFLIFCTIILFYNRDLLKESGSLDVGRMIRISSYLWIILLILMFISIIFPLLMYLIYNQKLVVGLDFYINVFTPLLSCSLILMSWKKRILFNIIIILFSFIITFTIYFPSFHPVIFWTSFCSIFALINIVIEIYSFYKSGLVMPNIVSKLIAHSGYCIIALTIALSSFFSKEIEFIGKVGDVFEDKNIKIKLEHVSYSKNNNYYSQFAYFIVDVNGDVIDVRPENRLYIVEDLVQPESSRYSCVAYDLYAVLSRGDNDVIYAKIYYKPYINMMWFGSLLLVCGIMISGINKKRKKAIAKENSI